MLPKGWHRSTLGDIARISSGGTPDRAKPEYWRGDVPWVTTGEIQFNTITDTIEKITETGLKNSSAKLFPPGTLLMAMYGQGKTRGQMAKLAIEAATNQACAAILLTEDSDPDFYFQYLSSQYDELRELGNAGTQKNLSGGILKGVAVPVPPYKEQRRIANILTTWDQAIAATQRLKANTLQEKAVLIAALLSGSRRLVGCNIAWKNVMLKDLCAFHKGGGLAKIDLINDGARSCILYGELFTTYGEVIRQVVSTTNSTQGFQGICGDVLIPTATTTVAEDLAKASALLVNDVSIGGDAIVLRPNIERVTSEFLAYTLSYSKRKEIAARAQGATIVHLSVGDLSHLRIALPPKQEQIAICQIFEDLNRQLELLQLDVQKLKQEKAALMAQLLTGKRRVHLPEAEMEVMA